MSAKLYVGRLLAVAVDNDSQGTVDNIRSTFTREKCIGSYGYIRISRSSQDDAMDCLFFNIHRTSKNLDTEYSREKINLGSASVQGLGNILSIDTGTRIYIFLLMREIKRSRFLQTSQN